MLPQQQPLAVLVLIASVFVRKRNLQYAAGNPVTGGAITQLSQEQLQSLTVAARVLGKRGGEGRQRCD